MAILNARHWPVVNGLYCLYISTDVWCTRRNAHLRFRFQMNVRFAKVKNTEKTAV